MDLKFLLLGFSLKKSHSAFLILHFLGKCLLYGHSQDFVCAHAGLLSARVPISPVRNHACHLTWDASVPLG